MSLSKVHDDVSFLKQRYAADHKGKSEGRLVILSEKSSKCYNTDVLTDILQDEGGKMFDARNVKLGHTLQGGTPSPRDRTRAVRLAVRCIQFIERHGAGVSAASQGWKHDHTSKEGVTAAVLVIEGAKVRFASLREVEEQADMKLRRGKDPWWLRLRPLVDLMSGRLDLVQN